MISQANAIVNGAVSADWILTTAFVVIGALITGIAWLVSRNLIETLKVIQQKLEEHDEKFEEQHTLYMNVEKDIALIKQDISRENDDLADLIVTKMRAASGR
jgi:hypothetical protein